MKYTTIDVDETKTRPAIVWARETFGMPKSEGVRFCDMRWFKRNILIKSGYFSGTRFYFRNTEDATIFALRWS